MSRISPIAVDHDPRRDSAAIAPVFAGDRMSMRGLLLLVALLVALLAAPLVDAEDACRIELGRGWPPATENYGSAVEQLLAGAARPALTLTRLPARGTESGVLLIPGQGADDWRLRYTEADKRVDVWNGGRRELRVDQKPGVQEVPMPARLAQRVATDWQRALSALVPADRGATFHEDGTTTFVVGELRISGLEPACGPGALLMQQAELMIKASDDNDKKRERRWLKLEQSLDELEQSLAGHAG